MEHNYENDTLYKIALTRLSKVGPVTAKNLISYCGSAKAVFNAKSNALLKVPGVGDVLARKILKNNSAIQEAESILNRSIKESIQILFYLDENYPQRLKNIPDSPLLLFYKGQEIINHNRVVAIVGTRKPTEYGKIQAAKLIEYLSTQNCLVISGLAYGIDITAHKKCLEFNVPTVGVLGSGLGKIYPHAHKKVAREMLEKGGLLTEFDFEKGPDRENFPMRNRLIAGMADAIVVIESAARGGSMITAEMGNGYNKDVFAIPGRPDDEMSAGCNQLIKWNKAHLIDDGADVARIMQWEETESPKHVQRQIFVELDDDERLIFEKIKQFNEIDIDSLVHLSQWQMSKLATVLLSLELKGLISTLPGKRYIVI